MNNGYPELYPLSQRYEPFWDPIVSTGFISSYLSPYNIVVILRDFHVPYEVLVSPLLKKCPIPCSFEGLVLSCKVPHPDNGFSRPILSYSHTPPQPGF